MIGLDANLLVRYVVVDDPHQVALVRELMAGLSAAQPGFVSLITVVELCWVLQQSYRMPARDVRQVISTLTRSQDLVVEDTDLVERALLETAKTGADIADALVAAAGRLAGCTETLTFDRRAARLPGMRLLS